MQHPLMIKIFNPQDREKGNFFKIVKTIEDKLTVVTVLNLEK